MISTVDSDARHGRKTRKRGFDGYKGHVAVDPDSEVITATTVTAGNAGEGQAVAGLLAEELASTDDPTGEDEPAAGTASEPLSVYGDSAYGAGSVLDTLERPARTSCARSRRQSRPRDDSPKTTSRSTSSSARRLPRRTDRVLRAVKGGQVARFGAPARHARCLRGAPPHRPGGSIDLGPHEQQLARGRDRQTDPAWQADYKATRPTIERKIGHLMRRRHGGRRARVRGRAKVNADFNLLAAAVNLARLATLGVTSHAVGSPRAPEAATRPETGFKRHSPSHTATTHSRDTAGTAAARQPSPCSQPAPRPARPRTARSAQKRPIHTSLVGQSTDRAARAVAYGLTPGGACCSSPTTTRPSRFWGAIRGAA